MFRGARLLYKIFASKLPLNGGWINIGQRQIRQWCCKGFCDYVGENVNIQKNAQLGAHISIGDNSGIGANCVLADYVSIGKNVMMGPNCYFVTSNHAFSNVKIPMMQQGFSERKPIYIEDDVWIGYGCIFLPGVRVGKGAIVGAGAVVTKDVTPFSIVGGNPAKVIRYRK